MNEIRKFVCDPLLGGCGKNCKEQRGLKGFRSYVGGVDEKEVEVEYVDLCEKCGKAKLREQKLLMRVTDAAAAEILP